MNKKLLWILIGSAVVVGAGVTTVLLMSTFKATTEHIRLIPKESFMVMSVNFEQLGNKMKLEDFRDLKMVKKAADNDKSDVLSDILENPVSSGVDFVSTPYFFVGFEEKDEKKAVTGYVFAIRSSSTFSKFLKEHNDGHEPKSKEGVYFVELDDNVGIAYDKKVAVFCAGTVDDIEDYALDLMKQKDNDNLAKDKNFQEFLASKADISFFLNPDEFPEQDDSYNSYSYSRYSNPMTVFQNSFMSSYKEMYDGAAMIAGLTFEDKRVNFTLKINYKDKDAADKANFFKGKGVSKDFLRYIPGKTYGMFSASIDAEKYLEKIGEAKNGDDAIKTITKSLGIEDEKIDEIFSGEIAGSVSDFKDIPYVHQTYDYDYNTYSYQYKNEIDSTFQPVYTLAIGIKDMEKAKKMFENEESSSYDDYEYDYYSYRSRKSYEKAADNLWYEKSYYRPPTYYALNKNVLVITNDSLAGAKIASGGTLSSGTISDPAGSLALNTPMMYYGNLNIKEYPKQTTDWMKKEMRSSYSTMKDGLSGFKNFTGSYSVAQSEININVDPGAQSSFAFLLTKLDKMYGKLLH